MDTRLKHIQDRQIHVLEGEDFEYLKTKSKDLAEHIEKFVSEFLRDLRQITASHYRQRQIHP